MISIHDQSVGIVVPVYKLRREYLDQCVNSILAQTHENIQIVLVDDCSPDNCGVWCEEMKRRDNRIRVVHHDRNMGLPIARNTGIDSLNVDWFLFVDGDDWIDADTCSDLLSVALEEECHPDIVIGAGYRSYPDKEVADSIKDRKGVYRTYLERQALQQEALASSKKSCSRVIALDSACGKLFSSSFLKRTNIRFKPLRYREDGMFFQEAVEAASTVIVVSDCYYHYRMTAGSMVNSYNPAMPQLQQKYLEMLREFAEECDKSQDYYEALDYAVFLSMQICITQCFYHPDNGLSSRECRRLCLEYFGKTPFANALDHVDLKELSFNHKIKAICMKLGWYRGVQLLRDAYLKRKDYVAYE